MNKTLMLVICDFLLLSMLALARFDPSEKAPKPTLDATASADSAKAELIALLEQSLESEHSSRENITSDLQKTRETLKQKAATLNAREKELERALANLEESTSEAEQLALQNTAIEQNRSALEQEQIALEARFEKTRSDLEAVSRERIELTDSLGQLKASSTLARERLRQAEEALQLRELELAQREAALQASEKEKQALALRSSELVKQLEVRESENRLLAANLNQEKQEKAVLKQEKNAAIARADQLTDNIAVLGAGISQLGSNVSTLTQSSEAIREEMEASRPQTASDIFTRFQNNRVNIRFTSTERGLLGGRNRRVYESKSILVDGSDGVTYLVTHTDDSPFSLSGSASIESAELKIEVNNRLTRIEQIGFLSADPRLIFIPLPQNFVREIALEAFPLATEANRWSEAVLIKNDESNFGTASFRRLTSSSLFLKIERPALGELLADFAASRGDLSFTRNSQFIGLLTDRRHSVVIEDFIATAVIRLGTQFSPENAAKTVEFLKSRVIELPEEVQ